MKKPVYYDAFISYRHLPEDKKVAEKLQSLLERQTIIDPDSGKRRHLHIFRDQSELPTSNDLGGDIRTALNNSKFLIIIYSKATQESKWCMEELNYFRSLHDNTNYNVLPLILEGEPDEVFPSVLRQEFRKITDENGEISKVLIEIEPLGADIRGKSLFHKLRKLQKTEYMRIAAPIMGCRFDDLYRRSFRQKVRRGEIFSAAILFVCFLIFMIFYNRYNAKITESAVYSVMSDWCADKDEWREALMYHAEAITRNHSLSSECTAAALLLQEQHWPCVTRIEDGDISNGIIQPSTSKRMSILDPLEISIRTMNSTAEYYLAGKEDQYEVYDLNGKLTAELNDVGAVMLESFDQAYWTFYRDGIVTLYHPGKNAYCKFTVDNAPERYGTILSAIHAIPSGDEACLVINEEDDSLALYKIDFMEGDGHLVVQKSLGELFYERYKKEMETYGQTLTATSYACNAAPEKNIILLGRTIEGAPDEAWSDVAVMQFSDLTCITVISDDSYYLNDMDIHSTESFFALAYGNGSDKENVGGYASVYDLSGTKLFCTDISGETEYRGAVFCNDNSEELILWTPYTIEFWNYQTGMEYAVPVKGNEIIRGVVCSEDAYCIAGMGLSDQLVYYNIVDFAPNDVSPNDVFTALSNMVDVDNQDFISLKIDENLVLQIIEEQSDEFDIFVKVILTDLEGNPYDSQQVEYIHTDTNEWLFGEECYANFTYSVTSSTLCIWINNYFIYRIEIETDKGKFKECEAFESSNLDTYVYGPTENGILAVSGSDIYFCGNNSTFWQHVGRTQMSGAVKACASNYNGVFALAIESQECAVFEFWDLKGQNCIADFKLKEGEEVTGFGFLSDSVFEYSTEKDTIQLQLVTDAPNEQAQNALQAIIGMTIEDGEQKYVRRIFDGRLGNWDSLKVSMR